MQLPDSATHDVGAAALVLGRLRWFLRGPVSDVECRAADSWLEQFMLSRRPRPVATTVWGLSEGDELEDGHIVLHVRRNPRTGTAQVVTSEPLTTPDLPGDAPVTVARL